MGKVKVITKPAKPKLSNKVVKAKKTKVAQRLKKIGVKKLLEVENQESDEDFKLSFSLSPAQSEDDCEPEKIDVSDVETQDVVSCFVTAPKLVDYDQVKDGIIAFMKYVKKTQTNQVELFDEPLPVFLQFSSVKVAKTPHRQAHFNLKHSLFASDSDICLIVKDGEKKKEYDDTIEHYENLLRSQGVTNVKTIMTWHQLKSEYGQQFELKRKLLGLYDCFLVDGSVFGYVTHNLGKIFYDARKMPRPVHLKSPNLKMHFEHVLRKTSIKINSGGDLFSLQVGQTNMNCDELYDNVVEVVDHLNEEFPGGFDNIRMMWIKTDKSIGVPLYLSLRHRRSVPTPKIKAKRPKMFEIVSDELSTFANRRVTVLPSGDVFFKDDLSKHNSVDAPKKSIRRKAAMKKEPEDEFDVDEESDKPSAVKEEIDEDEGLEDKLDAAEEMYLNEYQHEQKLKRKQKPWKTTQNGPETIKSEDRKKIKKRKDRKVNKKLSKKGESDELNVEQASNFQLEKKAKRKLSRKNKLEKPQRPLKSDLIKNLQPLTPKTKATNAKKQVQGSPDEKPAKKIKKQSNIELSVETGNKKPTIRQAKAKTTVKNQPAIGNIKQQTKKIKK